MLQCDCRFNLKSKWKKYFKRKSGGPSSPLKKSNNSYERHVTQIKLEDLLVGLSLRIIILGYNYNIRDEVRRTYLQKGPCQPQSHFFVEEIWVTIKKFNPNLFIEYPNWLGYSISKDSCLLFMLLFIQIRSWTTIRTWTFCWKRTFKLEEKREIANSRWRIK